MSYLDPFIAPRPAAPQQPDDHAEQRAFQEKQHALIGRLYNEETKAAALAEYEANLASLTGDQKARWHANIVDPDKFSLYSDLYKDENGIRPRFHVTIAEIEKWLEARRSA